MSLKDDEFAPMPRRCGVIFGADAVMRSQRDAKGILTFDVGFNVKDARRDISDADATIGYEREHGRGRRAQPIADHGLGCDKGADLGGWRVRAKPRLQGRSIFRTATEH